MSQIVRNRPRRGGVRQARGVRIRPVLAAGAVVAAAAAGSLLVAPAQARVTPLPLAGRVVAIDPGHQLGNSRHPEQIDRLAYVGLWKPCNTTGTATQSGFPEATFTWRTSRALMRRLERSEPPSA